MINVLKPSLDDKWWTILVLGEVQTLLQTEVERYFIFRKP